MLSVPPDHFVADTARHRFCFAAEHGFVDMRTAFDHFAIHRDFFAGTHQQFIARLDGFQRHILKGAVAPHPCRARAQADQMADRIAGASPRPCFQITTEQDQRHDHRCGFEVHIVSATRQPVRHKRGHHRITPGGGGADHHQRVHVRGQAAAAPGRPARRNGGRGRPAPGW